MLLNGVEGQEREAPAATTVEKKTELSANERALKAEIKAMKAERQADRQRATEAENTARFWHDKAQTPAAAVKTVAKKEENPADFIERLTEGGAAAIDELLAERGYLRKDEVEARIAASVQHARQSVTVEAKLAQDYPDLEDSTSDFFKETAAQYQALISETPELKGNPKTMRLAAKLAAAEFEQDAEAKPARGKAKKTVVDDDEDGDETDDVDEDEDDTPAKRETSRVRRVNSQSVSSRRVKRDGNDETLDPMQKSIVANLRAAGSKITEESLIKRIQGGTKLSGRIGMAAAAMTRRRTR